MTRRVCFALDLIEDAALIAEYDAIHAFGKVPAYVIDDLGVIGFLDMEIWRTGNRCFMVATVTDDFPRPREQKAQDAADRWEDSMWHYQKPLPHAAQGEKWVEMSCIFLFDKKKSTSV